MGSGGGLRYLEGLVGGLAATDRSNDYVLLPASDVPPAIATLPHNFRWEGASGRPTGAAARLLWEQVQLPWWARRRRLDVLFSTADRTALAAPCPAVLLIQNLNPYEGPRADTLLGRVRERALAALTWASARRARRIIFVSEYSRGVICRALGIDRAKTDVVHHGVDQRFVRTPDDQGEGAHESEAAAGLDRPYVLTVTVVRRHKNLGVLLDALAQIDGAYDLVIAGPIVERGYERELRQRAARLGIAERVRFVGPMETDRLAALYRGAVAFVFTSLTETFGLPLVEAMASGAPVIASRIGTAREVCGEAALYFAPTSGQDLAAAMRRVLADPGERDRLRAGGTIRARAFSWRQAADRTRRILEECVGGR